MNLLNTIYETIHRFMLRKILKKSLKKNRLVIDKGSFGLTPEMNKSIHDLTKENND